MYTKDDVTKTIDEIGKREIKPPVELGKADTFGLGLDLFDPVSGQIITVFRPHRADIGQSEIRLTADQVAVAVAQARTSRVHNDRAKGIVPPLTDAQKAAQAKAVDAAKADAAKAAKAAADAQSTAAA